MRKCCLVTGATGHLGNRLVERLLNEGYIVKALVLYNENTKSIDRLSSKSNYHNLKVVFGDILQPKSLNEAFEGADVVYHVAGMIYTSTRKEIINKMRRINVEGTANIIAGCIKSGARMVYVSSIEAISNLEKCRGNESILDICNPYDIEGEYARSKAAATTLVARAVTEKGLDGVIVFPSAIIGPYDPGTSLMGKVIKNAGKSSVFFCIDGLFNWVNVDDVARGIELAAKNGKKGGYYLLYGHDCGLKELLGYARKPRALPPIKISINAARFFAGIFDFLSKHRPRYSQLLALLNAYSIKMVTGYRGISQFLKKKSSLIGYKPKHRLTKTVKQAAKAAL
jgi:dihydroflavonol-4-reductase